MKIISSGSRPKGKVAVPASKSHSIRAIFLASLADGVSNISNRLKSADANSAIAACRSLGAIIEEENGTLKMRGTGGKIRPINDPIDVGNSGTTARFALSMAALSDEAVSITGDEQTRKRPMMPLCRSLEQLGVELQGSHGEFLPIRLKGPIEGGTASVDGTTSQYLSSLLLHAPLCREQTTLILESLNEKPYVDMTIGWLEKVGVKVLRKNYSEFIIPPNQTIKCFNAAVPADFSSAAFFLALSAIEGTELELEGLDMDDNQGDKMVIDFLKEMGADIECGETIRIKGKKLKGATLDLNATPDALPAMAVVGCLAEGTTRLSNVPQARIKETDRIAVMAAELKKMGADIEEEEEGLVIRHSPLKAAVVDGHSDHRVVMSLAVAGLAAKGVTTVTTAEAINVTFPNFVELMSSLGAIMFLET
ncbi:MAG: 3-phosphoshikimate 1-carboxyvinyltransferase [Nitrospinota bacterium]